MKMKKKILPLLIASVLAAAGCTNGKKTDTFNTDSQNQNAGGSDSAGSQDQNAGGSDSAGSQTQNDIGENTAGNTDSAASDSGSKVSASEQFSDRDLQNGYDEEGSAAITLNGTGASCSSNAVKISGSRITITDEGTYILSGTLQDGMVIVDADKSDKVQLVFNSAEISSSSSAAVYVRQADKVFLTTAADTENTLSNGGTYEAIDENNIDAAVFSKDDLTLNGTGSLQILAKAGHGIVCKDSLVLAGGNYGITAENHGLSGKDSICIADGTFQITAGKDGIHAENTDDASLGFLYILDGEFDITSEGDGISSAYFGQIENGSFKIQAGGGFQAAADADSTKGIKAGGNLWLDDGTYIIDSADDSLHTNSSISISGGSYQISSGDDGIHADGNTSISGGTIDIPQSFEGIEGKTVTISGGNISLVATDDGLNAAGGADSSGFGAHRDSFTSSEDVYISISGGTINVTASGDGIDSNGDLAISGGQTYVSGPSGSGNGSLDYNGEAIITGGIFAASGAMGMVQNFGSSSTQGAMLVQTDAGSEGDSISLADADGNVLVSWQAQTDYGCVIISCPQLSQGNTYTLTAGNSSSQIEMTSLIYGQGSGAGRGAGGKDGKKGGMGGHKGGAGRMQEITDM